MWVTSNMAAMSVIVRVQAITNISCSHVDIFGIEIEQILVSLCIDAKSSMQKIFLYSNSEKNFTNSIYVYNVYTK